MQKRQREQPESKIEEDTTGTYDITPEFIETCEKKFKANPANIIARNAINSVGSLFSTMSSTRRNEISHVFLNSIKKHHLRATNQGASGRCWMFAALNTFRHILINALDLDNFEFSEVYLFFWDKFERSNSFLLWFMQHPEYNPSDREYEYMITSYMSDGGWWNTFANLVSKYGVVPKDAMKETHQSTDSEDMNQIIQERLNGCVNHIRKNRGKLSQSELNHIRLSTLSQIYDILVKFLGEPPKKFNWAFSTHDEEHGVISKLTPHKFLTTVVPEVNMNTDFITLAHIPSIKMYTRYKVRYTNNVQEGENCEIFNVPIEELTKYAMKSISHGFGVWFVGDVRKCFDWFNSTLDDKMDDSKVVFEETFPFDKTDRIIMRNVEGNHAMALTGFNVDERGRPTNWQVENSWGYWDYETPGLDGFLNMSHSWFEKYLTQIVVHRQFLSRTILKKLSSAEVVEINPWDSMAPALRSGGHGVPCGYVLLHQKKN